MHARYTGWKEVTDTQVLIDSREEGLPKAYLKQNAEQEKFGIPATASEIPKQAIEHKFQSIPEKDVSF